MIDASALLRALQRLEKELEDDLRTRVTPDAATSPQEQEVATELDASLRAEFRDAKEGGRTGQAFEVWRDEFLTQVAVAWILGCVFVRFMEDNGLVETPRLSGPGERRQRALDQHELYFKDPERRTHSDREYLLAVFEQTQKLPAAREVFDAKHNPLWAVGLSGDGATKLLQFWQRLDPETGALDHDFIDPDWNTRFLGDLYQDLSESARKKYALLQTPEFVEEFILDRTLTPAIDEFGFQEVRLIDPTCGSGHFLLGAFDRLFALWVKQEPGANPRELVQRALDQVYGVDLNPFAVAIAKFRILVEALKACNVKRLADAPGFHLNLAVGDSLLHGRRPGLQGATQQYLDSEEDPLRHVYDTEDADALRRILGRQYHGVVGNPPYITVKDKALNQAYRDAYSSCYRQYSLGVPFTQRFFELSLPGDESRPAGFVGMITANSFMKREFGKKLVEETLPKLDLTHVIDTSGAYIPGHGTPTVILLGRNRRPVGQEVRAAMGIRGEPKTPSDPSQGQVWRAIVSQLDAPGSESEFVSVEDYGRERFAVHPWSLRGGGAAELRSKLEGAAELTLKDLGADIGFLVITGEDNCLLLPADVPRRVGVSSVRHIGHGEAIRDWSCETELVTLWPYTQAGGPIEDDRLCEHLRFLWPYRRSLKGRKAFGIPVEDRGIAWWALRELYISRLRSPLSIAFAFVATHNHFVLDRGGMVFKRSAPVIKLPPGATENDYLALLALLNSSIACFWMKQVFHNKGSTVDQKGARQTTVEFENFYEFTGTGLKEFPLAGERFVERAKKLLDFGGKIVVWSGTFAGEAPPSAELVSAKRDEAASALKAGIAAQEELDWGCYRAYGLLAEDLCYQGRDLPAIKLGQRAFEVVIARKMAKGDLESVWFERHGSKPITELPQEWPDDYRRLVDRRIALIEADRNIRLIEQPEFKRRWNKEPFEKVEQRFLRAWLLDHLEAPVYWSRQEVQTTARLADRASQDMDFMQVAELYAGRPDFDLIEVVRELVEGEAVPVLSASRYKATGLRKRVQWEETWWRQRQEDLIDARTEVDPSDPANLSDTDAASLKRKEIGDIPVPPKYTSADFQKTTYWRRRGKLDVPKERFVSFPHCERDADPSPVVGWAGWNHLELAQATAAYYLEMKEQEGWAADRLTPLLTALLEIIPWVKQWHNDPDPEHGVRMGDYFDDFVNEEARALGFTLEQINAWTPPKKKRNSKPRKKATRKKKTDTEVITI